MRFDVQLRCAQGTLVEARSPEGDRQVNRDGNGVSGYHLGTCQWMPRGEKKGKTANIWPWGMVFKGRGHSVGPEKDKPGVGRCVQRPEEPLPHSWSQDPQPPCLLKPHQPPQICLPIPPSPASSTPCPLWPQLIDRPHRVFLPASPFPPLPDLCLLELLEVSNWRF